MAAKVAVVLSGCGYLDGAEIQESVFTLYFLDRSGVEFSCFAPDKPQMHVVNHLTGDATDEHILEQAGIRYAATVATVLSQDATNVFVTVTAREMNPDVMIIARGENPKTEKKLLGCGANRVVLPTAIGAKKLAQLITRPTAENMLEQIQDQSSMIDDLRQIGLEFDELQVQPNSVLVDHAISEIEIRSNHGFLIVGIRHADGTNEIHPDPRTKLTAGDVVVVLGHRNDIPELASRFSAKRTKMTYRGATIER